MENRYKLADISIWFTPKNGELAAVVENHYSVTCPSSPRGMVPNSEHDCENRKKVHKYFLELAKHEPLYATTITIGTKYVGCMSYHDQYKHIIKLMKLSRPRGNSVKCIYHFELNSNGQLHAHGIETGGYAANFRSAFGMLGKHNLSKASYMKVNNLPEYMKYINKENIKPYYYNVMKKEINKTTTIPPRDNKHGVAATQDERNVKT